MGGTRYCPACGNLVGLGLPLATIEDEWGPGHVEFTFDPQTGTETADAILLVRSAVRQLAQSHGCQATFGSRPAFPNAFSSGCHLHRSLRRADTDNAFTETDGELLSATGRACTAGLPAHALERSVLTTLTINGYERYRPDSFAPARVAWAEEDRGTLIRVVGDPRAAAYGSSAKAPGSREWITPSRTHRSFRIREAALEHFGSSELLRMSVDVSSATWSCRSSMRSAPSRPRSPTGSSGSTSRCEVHVSPVRPPGSVSTGAGGR
ncbi:glutamine synthetase [Streptomyces werraensis]|uniref:glutamine synthetase n=1 Tax=Streptomyces werraensis TaxID=68284 RepID=UPI001CE36AFB